MKPNQERPLPRKLPGLGYKLMNQSVCHDPEAGYSRQSVVSKVQLYPGGCSVVINKSCASDSECNETPGKTVRERCRVQGRRNGVEAVEQAGQGGALHEQFFKKKQTDKQPKV
ncbi:putative LRR receptor-like serine/threonine-protein kinase IRK [Trichinella spiralis]|uniref:LRR receptor-like serine/threonine-protein kinase IRK n=1 Tax=Trichinella spiralis TaxID=6334 RepID=A0ABR3KHD3_TRISP